MNALCATNGDYNAVFSCYIKITNWAQVWRGLKP